MRGGCLAEDEWLRKLLKLLDNGKLVSSWASLPSLALSPCPVYFTTVTVSQSHPDVLCLRYILFVGFANCLYNKFVYVANYYQNKYKSHISNSVYSKITFIEMDKLNVGLNVEKVSEIEYKTEIKLFNIFLMLSTNSLRGVVAQW